MSGPILDYPLHCYITEEIIDYLWTVLEGAWTGASMRDALEARFIKLYPGLPVPEYDKLWEMHFSLALLDAEERKDVEWVHGPIPKDVDIERYT